MTHYICVELIETPNGYHACKQWVAHQNSPVLTKAQIDEIGGVLVLFFALVVGYLIITKAIKMA